MSLLRSALLRRVLAGATQVALCLPFVMVTDCSTHEVHRYTGLEVLTRSGGLMLIPAAVAIWFLVRPLARDPAVGDALRCLGAATGGYLTLLPTGLISLFDDSRPLIGGWIAGVAWSGLWGATFGSSLRELSRQSGRVDPLFYAVVLTPHAAGLVAGLAYGANVLPGALFGLLFLLPVLLLGTVLTRRAPENERARLRVRALFLVGFVVNAGIAWANAGDAPILVLVAAAGALVALYRVFVPFGRIDTNG